MMIAGTLAALSGCIEPDLGEAPFYCNNGAPRCPDGYQCVGNRCLRNGISSADVRPQTDAATPDSQRADLLMWLDGSPPDLPIADHPATKWDVAPQDTGTPDKNTGTDSTPPHLGCQSNAECMGDPNGECCCPMPFVPQIWICAPLCLDPICLG
jgi:hypothetical protein